MKGAYRPHIDMNRVAQTVQYIASMLTNFGYSVSVSSKTDWEAGETPTETDLVQYLQNIRNLIAAYSVAPDITELPENMENLNWEGANAIEQVLADIDRLLKNMSIIRGATKLMPNMSTNGIAPIITA